MVENTHCIDSEHVYRGLEPHIEGNDVSWMDHQSTVYAMQEFCFHNLCCTM